MGLARLVLVWVAMVMHTAAQFLPVMDEFSPERFLMSHASPSSGPSSGPMDESESANTTESESNTVVLTMHLTVNVTDVQAFIDDEDNAAAIEAGIANATGVDAADITVALSLPGRRLSSHEASGNVVVEATFTAANAGAVSSLQATVDGVSSTAMADALNEALEATGVTVQVASMVTAVPSDDDGDNTEAPRTSGDSAAFKAAEASKVVLGLIAPLAFFSF